MTMAMISQVNVQTLDHLGLVAAVVKKLGLVEKIDERLPTTDKAKVSMGQRALALILNGLGFTNDRLYLMPRFFENKPVERLIGPGIKAEDLNDDALGRLLDAIAGYGSTRLFSELAFEIGTALDLLGPSAHLDTTTLMLEGDYAEGSQTRSEREAQKQRRNEPGDTPLPKPEASDEVGCGPLITYGHSKAHRPDIKQVVLSLITTGPSAFPLWMESLDGNNSDKTSFHETQAKVIAFQRQLKEAKPFVWVADSALYTIAKLLAQPEMLWITRVPATLTAAKALLEAPRDRFDWQELEEGYQFVSMCSEYGGLRQRWLLIYSSQAYDREHATFERRLDKTEAKLAKEVWHLGNSVFATEDEAKKAADEFAKSLKYHNLEYTLEAVAKYTGRGRPKVGQVASVVGYRVQATLIRNDEAISAALNSKGRFILATNQLDSNLLSDLEIFQEHKEQSQVESGFRFLKDPWFMVDSVFLKNPRRIEALMMIMTLCLMVYNVGQYQLRESLKTHNDTLPNQVGKETNKPTFRWVFQLMEGISVVHIELHASHLVHTIISNLDALRQKIIRHFGQYALEIYGMT